MLKYTVYPGALAFSLPHLEILYRTTPNLSCAVYTGKYSCSVAKNVQITAKKLQQEVMTE